MLAKIRFYYLDSIYCFTFLCGLFPVNPIPTLYQVYAGFKKT